MTQSLQALCLALIAGITSLFGQDLDYISENLVIRKLADGVYMHTSFLETQDFGKVPCNGMVVSDGREAVVFDTPATDSISSALIDWVEDQLKCSIKAVIPTHFHADCLGGLDEFHRRRIPSYANSLTIVLASANGSTVPQHSFDDMLELAVGSKNVIADFIGAGHTRDNVVGYFPDERILFGGCLIKAVGSDEGNLADALVDHWTLTGIKLKAKYPEAKLVIPGHGEPGDTSLLDYTIQLFEQYRAN
ncbi:subclass B1 metallo-beta-lactamase [Parapedobacter deserti]|uniref:beta-lactamase n=1 Tax=Parapedobacter deserti TaxID=1912957 RepID=A0ABV7JR00_9SPHI